MTGVQTCALPICAFGEAPWDVVGIGVMTDTDNTRSRARAYYGDITLYEAP